MIRLLKAGVMACLLLAVSPAIAKEPLAPGDQVDLNGATTAELMRLPGIGRKRAEAIVAYRAKRPFRSTKDVLRIKGLGRKWFSRVKSYLTIGDIRGSTSPVPATGSP